MIRRGHAGVGARPVVYDCGNWRGDTSVLIDSTPNILERVLTTLRWHSLLLVCSVMPTTRWPGSLSLGAAPPPETPVALLTTATTGSSPAPAGVGFFISPDRILTCRHVAEALPDCVVRCGDGITRRAVSVVGEDEGSDLIVVVVDHALESDAPLEITDTPPTVGSQVRLYQREPDGRLKGISGRVADTQDLAHWRAGFLVDAPAASGWSGAPILDDKGNVVGVLREQFSMPDGGFRFEAAGAGAIRRLKLHEPTPWREWSSRARSTEREEAKRAADAAVPLWANNDLGATAAQLRKAVAYDPTYRRGWRLLAACLQELRGAEEYCNALGEYVRLEPQDDQAWYLRGMTQAHLGYVQGAADSLREASRLSPSADSWYWLGWCDAQLHRPEDAISAFRKALELDPRLARASLGLGRVLSDEGAHGPAVSAFTTAIAIEPTLADARRRLIVEYVVTRQAQLARRATDELVGSAEDAGRALVDLGVLLSQRGQRPEAVAAFRRAIEIDQDSFEARRALATELGADGDWAGAAQEAEALVRIAPNDPTGYSLLGYAQSALGRFSEAADADERAVDLGHREPALLFRLGFDHLKAGHAERAAAVLAELTQKDPGLGELLSRCVRDQRP